jgi:hypothetical protein
MSSVARVMWHGVLSTSYFRSRMGSLSVSSRAGVMGNPGFLFNSSLKHSTHPWPHRRAADGV